MAKLHYTTSNEVTVSTMGKVISLLEIVNLERYEPSLSRGTPSFAKERQPSELREWGVSLHNKRDLSYTSIHLTHDNTLLQDCWEARHCMNQK